MNRIGFLLLIAGLMSHNLWLAFAGFLIYEFSRPMLALAFIST